MKDHDEALRFFIDKLNFDLLEDTYIPDQDKRWVSSLQRVIGVSACYWQKLRHRNRCQQSVIRLGDEFSSFRIQMIFGEIMIHQKIDKQKPKGWFSGPWDSSLPIPVGYANECINEKHYHSQMYEIYLVAKGKATIVVDAYCYYILKNCNYT